MCMAIILLGDTCCTLYIHRGEQKGQNKAKQGILVILPRY